MKNLMLVVVVMMVTGCSAFAGPPREEVPQMSDAATAATDGGPALEVDSGHAAPDSGTIEMPAEIDAGAPLGEVPTSGFQCDPDRDRETYDCALEGCDRAYLVCLGDSFWHCVPDTGALCELPHPETDAGVPASDAGSPVVDAGRDTGCDLGVDAGPVVVDAGRTDSCRLDIIEICVRDAACGALGYRLCNIASGNYDGECLHIAHQDCPVIVTDAGSPAVDAGTDAGSPPVVDAGSDAGRDLGTDAGPPPVVDAGSDAGHDMGTDAGTDAGPTWTSTGVMHMCLDISSSARLLAICPTLGTVPDIRLFLTDGSALSSDRASCIDVPTSRIGLGPWNIAVWCQPDTGHMTWADGGYFSPRVIGMPLNTAVSTSDFTDVSIDGRPARANTFYCWDTSGDRTTVNKRRVQVQVVAAGSPLPTSCASGTGI